MADINDWIIIYRGYTAAQIAADQTRLQAWLANPFNSQGQGAKSYSRDRDAIVTQLAALQRVLNETSGAPCIGIMDASAGIWAGQEAVGGLGGIGANGYPDTTSW